MDGDGQDVDVRGMFNQIAWRYDVLNSVLSFGMDRHWRARMLVQAERLVPSAVLDLACGTCDVTLLLLRRLRPDKLVGGDLSSGMLAMGREKLSGERGGDSVCLVECAAEALPFENDTFDLVTIAFGVRNFSCIEKAFSECRRVLRPGGHILILEFSHPSTALFRWSYNFYSHLVLPIIGGLVSGSFSSYRYLPRSIDAFVRSGALARGMELGGIREVSRESLTFGVAELVLGVKEEVANVG